MKNKVFFLDRDGVINFDHGYVGSIEKFNFIPDIFEACQLLLSIGYKIIIVTNQAGIARGLYSEEDFYLLTNWMLNEFKKNSIDILAVYHCPHHPEKGLPEYRITCDCRKPEPGMILSAAKEHSIDLEQSAMVGDKESDLESARRAGIKNLYFVKSRYESHSGTKVFRSLLEVAEKTFKLNHNFYAT